MPPVTKSKSNVFLIGQTMPDFPDSAKLPTTEQVLKVFFYYIHVEKYYQTDAANITVSKLFDIWKNKIKVNPQQLNDQNNVANRLIGLYKNWKMLWRNRNKNSDLQLSKRSRLLAKFPKPFDVFPSGRRFENPPPPPPPRPPSPPLPPKRNRKSIAKDLLAEALINDEDEIGPISSAKDDDFDPSTVDPEELQKDDDDDFVPRYFSGKKRKHYITDEICASLLAENLSFEAAFRKLKKDLIASGGDPGDYILSRSTVAKLLKEYQVKCASGQKNGEEDSQKEVPDGGQVPEESATQFSEVVVDVPATEVSLVSVPGPSSVQIPEVMSDVPGPSNVQIPEVIINVPTAVCIAPVVNCIDLNQFQYFPNSLSK